MRQNEQQVGEKYIAEVKNNFSDSLKVSFIACSVYPFLSATHCLYTFSVLADNEISGNSTIRTFFYLIYWGK